MLTGIIIRSWCVALLLSLFIPVFGAPRLQQQAVDFIGCNWQVGDAYSMQQDDVGNLYFMDASGYQQIEFLQLPYNPHGSAESPSEFMQVALLNIITQGKLELRFYQLTELSPEQTEPPVITYFSVAEAEAGHVLFFNISYSEISRVAAACLPLP